MKCEYCGSTIPDNSATCEFCNAEFEKKVPSVVAAEATPSGSVEAPTNVIADVKQEPASNVAVEAMPSRPLAATQSTTPAKKKGGKVPLIAVVAVIAIIAVIVGVFAVSRGSGGSGGSSGSSASPSPSTAMPAAAEEPLKDASELAANLVERYEGYMDVATTGNAQSSGNGETRTYDVASEEINEGIDRAQKDLDALKETGENWEGYDQARNAIDNLKGALQYELDILEAQHDSSNVEGTGVSAAMEIINKLWQNYKTIDAPEFLKPYLSNTIETLPTIYSALVYSSQTSSTLANYSFSELISWWFSKQTAYDSEANRILIEQCKTSKETLESVAAGNVKKGNPVIEVDAIKEIAPNLYPSLDAALNLGVTTHDDEHSIMVTAEINGFTQKFEQKYELTQGYSYLPIKPALLTDIDVSKLSNNSTTQFDIKITDADTGEVLVQQSQPVNLLSIYDFKWTNDEFGATAQFDILAWLRPQADEVNAINRNAADIMGKWTGGKYTTLSGYQYGTDVTATLLQAAAIQTAISDAGVVYVMDPYSFAADQHILTPDAVIKKRQGLCIETSLLMASCLMSANMHPLIILTPGHAQVAVETYSGSGNYFLLETTKLPYSVDSSYEITQGAFYNGFLAAVNTSSGPYYWTTSGSSEDWNTYFEYAADGSDEFGGIFVIDCSLQSVMGIQGLENI